MADRFFCTTQFSERNIITESDKACFNIAGIKEVWIANFRPLTIQTRDDNSAYNVLYADTNEAPEFIRLFIDEDSATVNEVFAENTTTLYNTSLVINHSLKTQKNNNVFKSIGRGRVVAIVKDLNNVDWLIGASTGLRSRNFDARIVSDEADYTLTLFEENSEIGVIQIDRSFLTEYVPTEGGIRLLNQQTFVSFPHSNNQRFRLAGLAIHLRYVNFKGATDIDASELQLVQKGLTSTAGAYSVFIRPYTDFDDVHVLEFNLSGRKYYTRQIPNNTVVDVLITWTNTDQTVRVEATNFAPTIPNFSVNIQNLINSNNEPLVFGGGANVILYEFGLYETPITISDLPTSAPYYRARFDENFGLISTDDEGNIGIVSGYTQIQSGVVNRLDNVVWYDGLQQPKRIN